MRFRGGPQDGLVGTVSGSRPALILDKPRVAGLFDQELPEAVWQPKVRWYELCR